MEASWAQAFGSKFVQMHVETCGRKPRSDYVAGAPFIITRLSSHAWPSWWWFVQWGRGGVEQGVRE
eukprot:14886868-Alexandrium_andersonii.AAC.1